MNIFMILGTTATLLFSPHQPTTLQFENPIEYYSLGSSGDFDSYLTKNKKILLIRPKKEIFDEFLVVITRNHSYEFRAKSTPKILTALYRIHDGKAEKFYRPKYERDGYRVLTGRRSVKIVRTKGGSLTVNGATTSKRFIYYPKNAHLTVNGEAIE